MPIDARRRQKALLKKRKKDKERQKKRRQAYRRPDSSQEIHWLKNAGKYPLLECLIGEGWEDHGIAPILVSRRQPDGRIVLGSFLVDIYCLGVKDTFFQAGLMRSEYETLKRDVFLEIPGVPCPPGKAGRIIFGAIDYAKRWGFEPQADYELSRFVLQNLPEDGGDEPVTFGYEGKPFYVAGPHDDFEAIIATLKRTAGEGNFDFMAPLKISEERSAGDEGQPNRKERRPADFRQKHPELAARLYRAINDQDKKNKTTAELLAEYQAALQLKRVLESSPGRLEDIEDDLGVWLLDWLLSLPFDLARQGLVNEAADLGKQFAEVHAPEHFLGDRGLILAIYGRAEGAIAQVDENLVRWPNDPWIVIHAGDAYLALKDYKKAEIYFCRASSSAGDDESVREAARERLIAIEEEQTRSDEIDALITTEGKEQEDELQSLPPPKIEVQARIVPSRDRKDRNAPCACGSGKKYKTCCGKKKWWRFW